MVVLVVLLLFDKRRTDNFDEVIEDSTEIHFKNVIDCLPTKMACMRIISEKMLPTLIADSSMTTLHDDSIWF